ncbi:glycerol-3-phosphate 1-O-acyltransferase PlsB [Marinobacter salarius]|jgi:glycerol-3-phosphate O-acyltransferase|uniref:Glycerol-3-phosphate acyltransferase n=1 Tax=Marinobacter salarius TaxID=1420917 RepID=A0A1W6KCW0_9GAMM|nr:MULTISPECIES: glycerol-3-phosphate 1-O-acyltransferase PlsB [Marinobacter]ARM85152.1 glycerol-3-phosphate acyltransferase [Marinobacter salarius]KXJ48732.1 MAG: glycerol-3-phosphate 1-O-acyltransferase [Marinobacter sp. Hex_13]MBJ7301546.1 glycerol-3-phosphate 1-O-acyltransferase PlsB [Marinobacter salarius]MBS8229724.1 glycerol-3-phosphate 1-O-acyltransferase PlsB [Marinobacter salarius]MCC4284640.1 glycerol-3-phosphate 1-O-acyltransferase PlsB [Marinobacter salarius]|tara:strand:- start:67 stop:2535 length:2469 start_codon:yes stop_codon:yes gene_type:complete
MRFFLGLRSLILTLFRKILFLWVRTDVSGNSVEALGVDPEKPVCYVLQYSSLSSRLVLEQEVLRAGLPGAESSLPVKNGPNHSFFFLYRRIGGLFRRRQTPVPTGEFRALVRHGLEHPEQDVQIVPVSLFWGRSPDKEKSLVKLLLSDTWSVAGRLQKFLIIMVHGRSTYVQFNQPLSLKQVIDEYRHSEERANRKLARILRTHFRRVRQAVLGPDLSHRRTLVGGLVRTQAVKEAIREAARKDDIPPEKVRAKAYKYADEIAASMSIVTIRFLEVVLSWLWNRIYNGIAINNIRVAKEEAQDNAVVYVPCHRSHIDYLLLSYVLYKNGLMPPHIAAGINLNMPIVGPILRRGGAFFMRRSFRDNPLYATVFNEYMHVMFSRGYSVEYFVEGGRSRTGRMLQPRPGMLSMTVRSFLRDHRKPIVFVPVYIGYEKVMEGRSYLGELRGKKKQKESVFAIAKTVRKLSNSFGQVAVNFGEAIPLAEVLNEVEPSWREEAYDSEYRPKWLNQAVSELSNRVASSINASVAVNPIGMTATVLLGTDRLAMDEGQLIRLMDQYADLLKAFPYADTITLPEGSGKDWVDYCENMGLITRQPQKLGDIIALEGSNAILMTYYRNNIQHLFALPSLIASLFENKNSLRRDKIEFLASVAYPYLKSELFLKYDAEEIDGVINQWIDVLLEKGLLFEEEEDRISRPEEGTDAMLRLRVLSRFIIQTLERYHIAIGILRKYGSGKITAGELEEQSTLLAERMSILFGLNAPEFFDKTLFRNFIANMQHNGVITTDDDGLLCYTDGLDEVAEDARLVLSVEKRQAIQQVTMLGA